MHLNNSFNNIKYEEPMKYHTSFKVGGKADIYLEPENIDELTKFICYLKENKIPYFLFGNGTNLLVSDEGIRGAVIRLGDKMSSIKIEGERIIAECGALLSVVSKLAAENSLSGLEFGSGIPGSVGGAVTMNAGAYDMEIKDVIEKVEVLDSNLQLKVLYNKQMGFGYRKSIISNNKYIVTRSFFKLKKGNLFDIKRKMEELTEKRQTKQPINYPSAGSVFKRPEGYFAGKLIEDAGLKGFTIGDAQISEKHCGFIINKGNATAKDIYNIIAHVQRIVYERFGVKLETEVKILGKF